MALIITIIVLMIITGIGIGASTGMKGNISESKETVATAELSKIQQAVLENYVKYKQMNLGKIGIIEAVIQSGNCGGTRVIAERRMRRLRKTGVTANMRYFCK